MKKSFLFLLLTTILSFSSCTSPKPKDNNQNDDPIDDPTDDPNNQEPTEEEILNSCEKITLDFSSLNISSKYSSGNYSTFYFEYKKYEYYRAVGSLFERDYLTLLPASYPYTDYGLSGAFYNLDKIDSIKGFDIEYSSIGKIEYGQYRNQFSQKELTFSEEFTKTTIFCDEPMNYFRLSTVNDNFYIKSLVVYYLNERIDNQKTYSYEGERKVIEPISSLIDAESSMTLLDENGDEKEYTYYSTSYVQEHKEEINLEDVCYISPVDISNYFLAFHEFPANFVTSRSYQEVFGEYTRRIASYKRTDGYANSVPYRTHFDSYYPLYYELDVDINGYSYSSRGTARVVIWVDGFSCYEDLTPVCLYTDDHYATFQEYGNNGCFYSRFDAERNYTSNSHCPLETK